MAKAKRLQGIPGHYKVGPSIVQIALPLELKGTIKGTDDYILTLGKAEENYQLLIKWIRNPKTVADSSETLQGQITLPSEVVKRIFSMEESLSARARRDRALKATQTRKEHGVVPFQKKEAQT